ncbi:1,6-anhydro-N-acetylmuramyl-L-alanine amidase AmpD [Oceanobacter mangrovi]|uniref:1,6-anhydro-N-acetylmuramyl-L-alanine amidase AmpD n=1 Tax=Oceanobacter mangrovi TaxID=2862510 RepID=UPI001C8D67C3|nr:1,6-anhydro-N-acetylmuramyl-L-alanine amidase AmpD [Oceanobacter mangrovi]
MKLRDGRIDVAEWVPSPNFGPRPEQADISLLVIHNISLPPGQFGGGYVQPFFQNRLDASLHPYFAEIHSLQVSSHLLIERDGKLTQFVNLLERAWHAGVSSFQGRDNCNDFSIGIELEGDDYSPFTSQQYQRLIEVTRCLQQGFPLIKNNITGHQHIAPGRKTDPGPFFDWPSYLAAVGGELSQ